MLRFVKFCSFFFVLLILTTAISISAQTPTNIRITNIAQLNNEEQVCFNPTDSSVIVANWRDFRLGYRQIGIGYSHDGGASWSNYLIPMTQQYFLVNSKQSDPTLTVGSDGTFYMSVLDYDGFGTTNGSFISFYKSTNNGFSWSGPVTNTTTLDPTIFEDKQFITIDNTGGPYDGNLYCSWTRFPNPDRMMFVRSIDGGASFEDTVLFGPTQTSSACGSSVYDAGQFSIPVVTSNGDVHLFWQGIALDSGAVCDGEYKMKHVVSSDGGATFTYEDQVVSISGYMTANGGINTYSQPVAVADITGGAFDGNLYVMFANTNTTAEDYNYNNSDIDFIKSEDNGLTWSDRIQVNDYEFSGDNQSFLPWIVCNEDGILVSVFYDNRYDSPSYNLFDLVASYSFDGGETFTTNRRITDVSSSPGSLFSKSEPTLRDSDPMNNLEQPLASPEAGLIGEYIGVTAHHDKINAVWTDSRDGNSEVYTANWYLSMLEPRLLLPADADSFDFSPSFKWATAWKNDDDRYRVEFSTQSDFSTIFRSEIVDTNFFDFDSLLPAGDFYWRVKAFQISSSDSSEYSPTKSFTINPNLPVSCCVGIRGDANSDGAYNPDISDLLFMVDYMFAQPAGPEPACEDEADIDASGQVDIGDLLGLVDYMFANPPGEPPYDCPSASDFLYTASDGFNEYSGWFRVINNGINDLSGQWQFIPTFTADPEYHLWEDGSMTGNISYSTGSPISMTFNNVYPANTDYYMTLTGNYYTDSIVGTWNYNYNALVLNSGTFKAYLK